MTKELIRLPASLKKRLSRESAPGKGDQKYLEGDWKVTNFLSSLTSGTPDDSEETLYEYISDGMSVSSFSTNATMDNIPGPGRMLDKVYQILGRKVEWGIFSTSISSLHPNRILQFLYDYDEPYWFHAANALPLEDALAEVYNEKGSAAVAGLRSLMRQAQ